jgi:hypothetical protein
MRIELTSASTDGPVWIRQRLTPCNCGCKGKDSWHAAKIKRVVRNVKPCLRVDVPTDGMFRRVTADGEYKHPSGEMARCYLLQWYSDGAATSFPRWTAVLPLGLVE